MIVVTAKLVFVVILVQALLAGAKEEVEEEDGVLVLTTDNFNDVIKEHRVVMVQFHAPWCSACKHFAPEYNKLAKLMAEKDPKIKVAKVLMILLKLTTIFASFIFFI